MIDILQYLLKRKIRRILKSSEREKAYRSLEDIKTVLLLFDTKDFVDVNFFIRTLKNKKIKVKAYACKAKTDTKDYAKFCKTFTKNRLDWKEKSLNQAVNFMKGKTFDLVVDFSLKENIRLQYLLVLAQSPFKVGFYKSNLPVFDMTLSPAPESKSTGFVSVKESGKQLIHYLTAISSK
jgi:SHS2 domain-containing protein